LSNLNDLPRTVRILQKLDQNFLPSWTKNETDTRNLDRRILELESIQNFLRFKNIETAKLTSGGLLNTMRINLNDKAIRNIADRVNIYSAGDDQVKGLIKLLNSNYEIGVNGFNSAVFLELRSRNGGDYFVRALYKNTTDERSRYEIKQLPIENCDVECPLEKFNEIIKDRYFLPQTYFENCKRNGNNSNLIVILSIFNLII
jgi:hypothetical protein